jgi:hypothetical protein
VRRLGPGLGLLLLVGATPACLLYTERINQPPLLQVAWPEPLHSPGTALATATVSDPDGDPVTITWARLDRPSCQMIAPAEWATVSATPGLQYRMDVSTRAPFCVHVVARDSAGAEATANWAGRPGNRPPEVTPSLTSRVSYPLWSEVRLFATAADPDGDPLRYVWEVRDGAGAAVGTVACGRVGESDVATCFTADHPGAYQASVTVSDPDGMSTRAEMTFDVREDQPACLQATDPAMDTAELVMAVTDVRRFEVRQVSDDGNPWPPGPHGASGFRWYVSRAAGEWTRQIGFEGPTLDVRGTDFPDPRPGNVYRVRVEARDPPHDNPAGLRDLDDCDDTRRICERPTGCARMVWWSVRLQ